MRGIPKEAHAKGVSLWRWLTTTSTLQTSVYSKLRGDPPPIDAGEPGVLQLFPCGGGMLVHPSVIQDIIS